MKHRKNAYRILFLLAVLTGAEGPAAVGDRVLLPRAHLRRRPPGAARRVLCRGYTLAFLPKIEKCAGRPGSSGHPPRRAAPSALTGPRPSP